MSEKTTVMGSIGRWWTSYDLIVGIIFSILLVVGGIWAMIHNSKLIEIQATVTDASCVEHIVNNNNNNNNTIVTNCNLKVSYQDISNVDINYNETLFTNDKHNKGDTINILYNPEKPQIPEQYINYNLYGMIAIGIALIILGGSIFWYKFAHESNTNAEVAGVANIAMSVLGNSR